MSVRTVPPSSSASSKRTIDGSASPGSRAVAVGREQGADAGLALLDRLDPAQLEDYQPWHAATWRSGWRN